MASSKYPNNACCYYVSWDNVPMTAGLFIAENAVFMAICAYDFDPLTFLTTLALIYLVFKLASKSFKLPLDSCCSCECSSEQNVKTLFEKIHSELNSSINTFRSFSQGPKSLLLILLLLLIRSLNFSVLTVAYLVAMWSFIEPALIKFAGIPIRHMIQAGIHNNPLEEYLGLAYELIPKASIVAKND